MSITNDSAVKEALGRLTLRSLNDLSPLKNFSWNRVKAALININKTNARYYGDFLQLELIWHSHVIWLHTNGRGILYNPYISGGVRYMVVMPHDIQALVQEIWDINRTPIPINPKSN